MSTKPAKAAPQRPSLASHNRTKLLRDVRAETVEQRRPKRFRGKQLGTPVLVRLQPDLLAMLDVYMAEQDISNMAAISRPSAIRELIREWHEAATSY